MQEKTEKIVKQYRIHLQLPNNRIWDGTGETIDVLKEDCNRMLNGGASYTPAQATVGSQGLLLIYHPSFDNGKTHLGWISPFEVPEAMSARATIEHRLQAA